jgi:hypothetical protein
MSASDPVQTLRSATVGMTGKNEELHVNKPIDDLFRQADQQLADLESEIHQKQEALPLTAEVDRATAERFNRLSTHIASHPTPELSGAKGVRLNELLDINLSCHGSQYQRACQLEDRCRSR